MRTIQLTQGQAALVDDEDFEWLNQWKWYAKWDRDTKSHYAVRSGARVSGKQEKIRMHRLIMGCTKGDGVKVDHRNHNTLDNQRANLRKCTNSQNMMNLRGLPAHNTSGVVGVVWYKRHKKWQAFINVNLRLVHLGYYDSLETAINARRAAEIRHYGEFRADQRGKTASLHQ